MHSWIYVFLGGGLGSLVRYGISNYFSSVNTSFPIGTLMANFLACFLLGLLLGYQMKGNFEDYQSLLLITGFCGGFSTFSTFSGESLKLIQNQQIGLALTYIGVSIIVGLIAVYLGFKVQSTL